MAQDSRKSPAFTARSFDISLYSREASGDAGVKLFEGQTLSLSREDLTATVNEIGSSLNGSASVKDVEEKWLENTVMVKFHAISPVLDEKRGIIVDVGEADDARYRWTLEVKFESELNLLEMQL